MKKEIGIFHRKGFVQLLRKLGIFGLILAIEAYVIQNSIHVPKAWWAEQFVMSAEFGLSSILMAAGIFFLLARDEIIHIPKYEKTKWQYSVSLFMLNLVFAYMFYNLIQHMIKVTQGGLLLVFLWYAIGGIMVASLFFAIFPYTSVIDFLSKPRTLIGLLIGTSFAFWYQLFKGFWHVFALIVSKVVYFLLTLSYHDVTYSINPDSIPIIGTKAFNVMIAGPCSGIDGVKLFLILFTFFLVLDWKVINPVRALLLYFLGTFVMFTVNIIRVYAVLLVGNIINPEFAMQAFHQNVGWVLFTVVFIIFEYFTYNWMRKK